MGVQFRYGKRDTAKRFIASMGTIGAVSVPGFSPDQVLSGVDPNVLAEIEAQQQYGGKYTPVVGPNLPQRDNILEIVGNDIILSQPPSGTVPQTNTYRFYFYPPIAQQPELQSTSQLIAAILGDSVGELGDIGAKDWNGVSWASPDRRQAFTENVIKPLLYGVTTAADESDANIPCAG